MKSIFVLLVVYDMHKQFHFLMRKPVFGIFDQARHKPGCTSADGLRLEISDLESRGIVQYRDCTIYVVKTKALISFAVTAKMIWAFVFAYANSRFSQNVTQLLKCQKFTYALVQSLYIYICMHEGNKASAI